MNKSIDRGKIIQIINQVAIKYREKMVGRSFLYVFEGRAIEVIYRRKDFKHLTGVGSKLGAEQFFKNAVAGQLRLEQIFFNDRHQYDLCAKKISKLDNLPRIVDSDIFILEDIVTSTYTYKFGMTDLALTVCLSKDADKKGITVSNYYIARSLRIEDSFARSGNVFAVQYIFSKSNDERKYNTIMYADKNAKMSDLPDSVKSMLDDRIEF